MDADYLRFLPEPSRPGFVPPPGAVDAHCHVFGPAERFPFAPGRRYTPCDAARDELFALRDFLGLSRNVIVQATCHGTDNRALVDALVAAGDRARGVAVVDPDIGDAELDGLHAAGVRGVRFNFVRRLCGAVPSDALLGIAGRIERLGWHVEVYFEAADLIDLIPFLMRIPTPVVVDHMGRPDVAKGIDHPDFRRFLTLMAETDRTWVKISGSERLSAEGPPAYADAVPFARRLVERFPDRVLWGTDWPHPNMISHMPDDGHLLDLIPRVATDRDGRAALLIDNPMRLYWS